MSKVISFSISDRYLDQIRSLYPDLSDNLAAKQFVTDRLDSSLSSSLDVSLDDGLDGRVKTLVESELDGLLDERLDATVGKLINSLSERLARLESRLDGSLDGSLDESLDGSLDGSLDESLDGSLDGSLDESLDDGEPLLEREREASIASPIPNQENVEAAFEVELDKGAIEPHPIGRQGLTDSELARHLGIDKSNITRWKLKGTPTPKYKAWELRGRLWYEVD